MKNKAQAIPFSSIATAFMEAPRNGFNSFEGKSACRRTTKNGFTGLLSNGIWLWLQNPRITHGAFERLSHLQSLSRRLQRALLPL